jgi:pimeloyl-ACP methyl ester carboxylesterase
MKEFRIETSHAQIAVAESEGQGPAVLFIHGNSSCKEVFRHQMTGAIGAQYRCLAMDLPGHGKSSDAPDPRRSYSMPASAEAALEVLAALNVGRVAVIGWSLGGHIGIEMLPRSSEIAGLLITGTPPVGKTQEEVGLGFLPCEHIGLASKENFTGPDAENFAHHTCGVDAPFEPFLLEAVRRTDGRARRFMFEAFLAGSGSDQRKVVETTSVPVAVVNGGGEPFINNDYCAGLSYGNLWDGKVHIFPKIGHAPFWEAPDQFNPLLQRFLADALK